MSNEELVVQIQQGRRELMSELWAQVERFVSQQAGKRARALHGAVSDEDLYQSGYLALVAAVDGYDADAGMAFIGWLALHLKTTFAEAAGYRSERQRRDPLHKAASLSDPLGEDAAGTLADIVEDPDSTVPFEEVENRMWAGELRAALDTALSTLTPEQADTMRRRYFQGQTLETIATAEGVSKETVRQREAKSLRILRHPRQSAALRGFLESYTNYFLAVGASRFQTTHTSAVEEIAMMRERMEKGYLSDNLGERRRWHERRAE